MGSAVKRLFDGRKEGAGARASTRVFLAWLAIGFGSAFIVSYVVGGSSALVPMLALPIGVGGWLVYRRLGSTARALLIVSLVLCFWVIVIALQHRILAQLGF